MAKSLFFGVAWSGIVLKIVNRDKIQDSSVTPDNVLNIVAFLCHHIHESQTSQNGPVFFWPTRYFTEKNVHAVMNY